MQETIYSFNDTGKLHAIIVDIDGTLTQDSSGHRGMFEFDKCIYDIPNFKICKLVRALSFSYNIIILTAREEKYRHFTENWLKKYYIHYLELLMKQNDDKRLSVDAKEEIFLSLKERYDFSLAIDDQQDNIMMFNRHGLYTILV